MARSTSNLVTQAVYARSRKARGLQGGTRKAVSIAVSSGRIDAFGPDKLIDQKLADRQWAENTRVRAANDAPDVPEIQIDAHADLGDRSPTAAPSAATPPLGVPTSLATDPSYQEARSRQAHADARMAELRLAEQEGHLVRIDQVRAELASKLAPVRDALLQIPARLAPILAAQSDAALIQTQLEAEIHQVLAPLAGMAHATDAPAAEALAA